MNDKSISDGIDNFLEPEWNRAWWKLRATGYSDDEIWAMAASVEDASWPEDPPPGQEKEYYYAELINHILNLRDRVLNEEQPPSVWIEAGILVSILRSLAGHNDQAEHDFLQKQRAISRLPRKRTPSVAKVVVEHVLEGLPSDERTYTFFEQHIGADRRLEVDGHEIGVMTTSDESGKVIKYGFEKPGVAEPEWFVQGSIRSIIFRLNHPCLK